MYVLLAISWVFFGLMVGAVPASADSPAPPQPYMKLSENGEYIFVMTSPTKRGMYRTDGSTTPLWTVDWYAHADNVELLSDGIHLVRRGPWAVSAETEAVTFFAHGKVLQTYTVGDIVRFPEKMSHSISHFWWRAFDWVSDALGIYVVVTRHGELAAFNVTDGSRIVSIHLLLLLIVLGASPAIWVWWKRFRRESPPSLPNDTHPLR